MGAHAGDDTKGRRVRRSWDRSRPKIWVVGQLGDGLALVFVSEALSGHTGAVHSSLNLSHLALWLTTQSPSLKPSTTCPRGTLVVR
jgi:hypothetical protein